MKKKITLCIGVAMLSAAMAIGSPAKVFAEKFYQYENGYTVYEDEDGFQIGEDGVLVGYKGDESSIVVPDEVVAIGDYAFFGCESLISIELPESVVSIGKGAFQSCKALSSIKLPDGITSIGMYAFDSCKALTSIELPKGVTSIRLCTFYDCISLADVKLPEGLINIESWAFQNCWALTDIEFPDSITSIGYCAFIETSLSDIKLPKGLISIEDFAFPSLTSIELSENVVDFGYDAFGGGNSFLTINVSSKNSKYASYDGCLYNKDLTELLMCPSGRSELKFPEGVTSIGGDAFKYCKVLTNIKLPEGVTSIGDYAFSSCEALTSIELPESVVSIGENTFNGCEVLAGIYGVEGSYAQTYALENNIPFKIIQNTQPTGDTYIVDVESNPTVSASDFEAILRENKTKDVIFKTNNNITFTFEKGTMQAVNGKTSYDFQVNLTTDYNLIRLNGIPEDSFIEEIDFIYSGELPGKASIRIPVGESYVGKTFYYYLVNDNHTYTLVQSVIVDKEGYITVEQNHCSSYLVTNKKLQAFVNEETDVEDVTNVSKTDENMATVMSPSDTNKKEDSTIIPPKTGEFEELCFFLGAALLAVYIIFKSKIYNKV